ncbi:hypothetical protein CYPRO_0642 [Cyclonatronum proteinivorum]|uniref:Uncharacterized protein n=1 Tax=Cyclonatronum proteinivorum TaxID=1457365 RepID=A0A345UHH5_9BACT|nr:hypothetical protein [Cyclonatronum proteinivorum]AXI99926.1 hypothetical protein CYPRO_0642 [Cyclonatronum proteinivorum]
MYLDEIIPFLLILSLLAIFLVNRILKHKERLAMLEKGIVFPDVPKGGKSYVWARLGFVAFGLFLGIFIEEHFMSAFTIWLGGSLAGLGLLVSYLVFPIETASDPIRIATQPVSPDEKLPFTGDTSAGTAPADSQSVSNPSAPVQEAPEQPAESPDAGKAAEAESDAPRSAQFGTPTGPTTKS